MHIFAGSLLYIDYTIPFMKKSPFDTLDWWTGATGIGYCILLEELTEFYLKHKIPIGVKVFWVSKGLDESWNPTNGSIIWLKFEDFIKNHKLICANA